MWIVSNKRLVRALNRMETRLMTLQADVQKLVDEVAANKNLAKSANDALAAEATQIAALQDQVAKLTVLQSTGKPVDDEDLAAIKQAVADLADTNTAMQTAVPANTSAEKTS